MKGVLLALISAASCAQAQPATAPAFAAASVKPSAADARGIGMQILPGGRLVIKNYPLIITIAAAYNLPFNQSARLTGGPDWIRGERYDIEATAEKGAIPAGATALKRKQIMLAMLQGLLAERFKLQVRRETKELPVFAIVVAKDEPKLEKAKVQEKDCPETRTSDGFVCHEFSGGQGRGLHGQAVDMDDLAHYVENWAERPVIDKTGLKGLYKIETRPWVSMRVGPAPAAGAKGEDGSEVADLPTLFTVFTTMGLKLESQKAAVETFEILHVEKPSLN
jgi:uncharacterized protein (TIGR03435 family)